MYLPLTLFIEEEMFAEIIFFYYEIINILLQ